MKTSGKLLIPLTLFAAGLGLGLITRLLDIYTQNLGNMFSQMAIWILICTCIAIYSKSKAKAGINVFLFCVGMLITYYATAIITHGVYGRFFILAWSVFALFTPIMACFAWMTKEPGIIPKTISVAIVIVTPILNLFLFGGPRIYDFIIEALLVYVLFFKKIERPNQYGTSNSHPDQVTSSGPKITP